ncbi:hypothetical protein PIB30_041815 [Stylosanthes scabra]|uniref:RNase H type-1 domain-containing protein n=1 Tax=Stylosanthes scabra TaxID=79078 RepID=A0ABU6ZDU7_9FABA|nr:hypothetical protein [Stylosanthes scabra]
MKGRESLFAAGSILRYTSLFSDVHSKWLPPPQDSFKINCDASVMGLVLAWECGMKSIVCQTDSLDIYLTLTAYSDYVAEGDLLEKILELRLRSWDVQFEHINRDCNTAADFLAKQGAKVVKDYVEWLEPRSELNLLLTADLA